MTDQITHFLCCTSTRVVAAFLGDKGEMVMLCLFFKLEMDMFCFCLIFSLSFCESVGDLIGGCTS